MISLPGISSTVIVSSCSSSPSARATGASLRLSSALNPAEQMPQRTRPWATRRASAVTRKTVLQSGHWVYKEIIPGT